MIVRSSGFSPSFLTHYTAMPTEILFPLPDTPPRPALLNNLFNRLESLPGSEITWDRNGTDDFGEPRGEWHVSIDMPRKFVSVTHPDYLQAIHEAVERAENLEQEAYKAREAQRAAALAKLTPEERKLLFP